MSYSLTKFCFICVIADMFCVGFIHAADVSIKLAENGKALVPIVIAKDATPEMRKLADQLSEGLKKISGAEFSVSEASEGDSRPGLRVGTAQNWPGILPEPNPKLAEGLTREDYILKSDKEFLYVVGRTQLGTQDAVWDFLYHLGFRQYFPGKLWEIWPSTPDISVAINDYEVPSFHQRYLPYDGGLERKLTPVAKQNFEEWRERNRMISGYQADAGHVYNAIVTANKDTFAKHPEYLTTSGKLMKLDAAQKPVLDISAQYALDLFRKHPNTDVVSMAPSDGGGWRQNSPLGSPSNQALTIANYVAKAIQTEFPGKKVALLSYDEQTDPPDFPVDKNVIVKVSAYGRRGGHSEAELLKMWQSKGADVGLADPVFNNWNYYRDMPGAGRAADIQAMAKTIPEKYALGAHYWSGSTSAAWAPLGLGHYILSRILWNVGNAKSIDALLNDFFVKAFKDAAPEMREFYMKYLLAYNHPLVSEDLIGRMYRKLSAALSKEDSEEVKDRIRTFIPYVHYLELYLDYANAETQQERQQAYEKLAQFAKRCEESDNETFATYSIMNWMPRRDKSLKPWQLSPEGKYEPFTKEEILTFLNQGIANNKLVDFEPVAYSENLVPAPSNRGQQGSPKSVFYTVNNNTIFVYADKENTEFTFEVTGATIRLGHGNVRLQLFADKNVVEDEPVAEGEAPSDKHPHIVRLKTPYSGLHRLVFGDGSNGGTCISWPQGQRVSLPASAQTNMHFVSGGVDDTVFYVPKDTKVIGGYSAVNHGVLISPDGRTAFDFSKMDGPGYFSVPVAAGQTEAWWKFSKTMGKKLLLTVPPYLARTPSEALLPEELFQRR